MKVHTLYSCFVSRVGYPDNVQPHSDIVELRTDTNSFGMVRSILKFCHAQMVLPNALAIPERSTLLGLQASVPIWTWVKERQPSHALTFAVPNVHEAAMFVTESMFFFQSTHQILALCL